MKRPVRTATTGGFTLLEIMIVVAMIGLLAAIAIPNFLKARARSTATSCINNLRLMDDAKAQWALDTRQISTALPTDADLFGAGLYIKAKPICPGGGQYELRTVGELTLCDQPGHEL
jgi:prepilin-type N-terminal cleavage/methylation domain-containing protein